LRRIAAFIKEFKHLEKHLVVRGSNIYLDFVESPDLHALFLTYDRTFKQEKVQIEVDD